MKYRIPFDSYKAYIYAGLEYDLTKEQYNLLKNHTELIGEESKRADDLINEIYTHGKFYFSGIEEVIQEDILNFSRMSEVNEND